MIIFSCFSVFLQYLCNHAGDIAGVGGKDERVVGAGEVLEGAHVGLGHGERGRVGALILVEGLGHDGERLGAGLAGGDHGLRLTLRRVDQLLLLSLWKTKGTSELMEVVNIYRVDFLSLCRNET